MKRKIKKNKDFKIARNKEEEKQMTQMLARDRERHTETKSNREQGMQDREGRGTGRDRNKTSSNVQ